MVELYAELSEFNSARADGDPAHPQRDRAVRIRTTVRRVVEGQCSGGCKSSRCAIRRTLSALDHSLGGHSMYPPAAALIGG